MAAPAQDTRLLTSSRTAERRTDRLVRHTGDQQALEARLATLGSRARLQPADLQLVQDVCDALRANEGEAISIHGAVVTLVDHADGAMQAARRLMQAAADMLRTLVG